MAARRRRGWPARYPLPRPASCREHPHRRCGREPARANGPHGPQQHPRRADLPALIRRTAAETRRCDRRGRPGGIPQDGDSIWHVRGTRDRHPTVNVCGRPGHIAPELVFQRSAPGRIRTRDRLLRRSVCAAGQPANSLVRPCIGLSASDREFPLLTGRSGTQRARACSGEHQIRRSMEPVRPVLRNPESQVSVLPGVQHGRPSPAPSVQSARKNRERSPGTFQPWPWSLCAPSPIGLTAADPSPEG
jgi:hypothetical protein